MRAFDADLQLQVESIAGLPVALSNLSARGTLHEGRLEVHKFRGVINETPVLADGGLQWKDKRPHVDAKIRLPLFEISNWIADSNARGDRGNSESARVGDASPGAFARAANGRDTGGRSFAQLAHA